jgi:hypothetical protein
MTVYPLGQNMPQSSNLNSPKGAVIANAAVVPAGAGGGINVFSSDATDFVLDINGYYVSADVPNSLAFYPVTPCRIMDTRAGQGTTGSFGPPTMPTGGSTRTLPVRSSRCPVPANASAYSVNVTVVPTGKLGFLSLWPTGQNQPGVSTLNSWDATVLANAAVVPAGPDGGINVFTQNDTGTTDVIIDINGYFAPPSAEGLSFYPLNPCRAVDTRPFAGRPAPFGVPAMSPGETRSLPLASSGCGLPNTAKAYALNATVVPSGYLGYLSIWPSDQTRPLVSTLNSYDGRIVANMAMVPASATGAVSIFTDALPGVTTDVILDVFGYFAP